MTIGDTVEIQSAWSCYRGVKGVIESEPKHKFKTPHWMVRVVGFEGLVLFGERELACSAVGTD